MYQESRIDELKRNPHAPFISYNPAPRDKLVVCPYDPGHHVRTTKLVTHLLKCRRNHMEARRSGQLVGPEIEICRYNSHHHIPAIQLNGHHQICPEAPRSLQTTHNLGFSAPVPSSQETVERKGEDDGDEEDWGAFAGVGSSWSYPQRIKEEFEGTEESRSPAPVEEDWEEECRFNDASRPSYNPLVKVREDARFSYIKPGLSKVGRRRMLEQETARLELARLEKHSTTPANSSASSSSGVGPFGAASGEKYRNEDRDSVRFYTDRNPEPGSSHGAQNSQQYGQNGQQFNKMENPYSKVKMEEGGMESSAEDYEMAYNQKSSINLLDLDYDE